MKEQILALAVQSGFKPDWAILNCTGQFESFYHAAIESYKAELLKEAGEPVGCHYLPNNEMFPVEEVSRSNLRTIHKITFFYTSDQVAAAILKATGPLEKEIERLKTVPMKYRRMAFNAQLQDENAEFRRQLASAQLDNDQLRAELSALKADNATAWAQAHRLALELECLLLDTKDNAIVSKWWDSGMAALDEYQQLKPGAAEEAEAWVKMRKEML